jgi:hypothetical protein
MALKKETNTDFGIPAEYWKIVEFTYYSPRELAANTLLARGMDIEKGAARLRLALFKDRAGAQTTAKPFKNILATVEVDLGKRNVLGQLYQTLKTSEPELKDADDILEEGQRVLL